MLAIGLFSWSAMAQQKVTGVVKENSGIPVLGAKVSVVGQGEIKTLTDQNGTFTLNVDDGDVLEINYGDALIKRVKVNGPTLNIKLSNEDLGVSNRSKLQNNSERTQAISTLSGDNIKCNSSINVGDALYGMMPGLIVKQNTGWTSNPSLIVRGGGSLNGTTPLVVVDGIPRDMKYLNMLEVESISVLKDGAATALWGTRGANGVIIVTTKRGHYSDRDIEINYSYGMGLPVNQPEFVDGYTFAKMKNEALQYDGLPLAYDEAALSAFKDGSNRDLYANTDWQKAALRNHTSNNQLNMIFRGGGKSLRYYSIVNYKNDYGIIREDLTRYSDRYTAQMRKYHLNARVNLDLDITQYTRASLSMFAMLQEDNRPRTSEEDIFSGIYHVPASAFPVKTSTGNWGGDNIFKYNPIAKIADVGYFKTNQRLLQSDFRLYQDFSMVTKGLSAELGIAYDNSAVFQETGSKNYMYEVVTNVFNPETGKYELHRNTAGDNSALSISNSGLNSQFMRTVIDGKVAYDRFFGLHGVTGTLQYRQESYMPMGRNKSRKRQSYIFTGGYNYDNRYLIDIVVNQSGTSVLSEGDKFRTYPAFSAAWVISNESFLKKHNVFDLLKLRASWGRSGNDNIDYELDRRFWIGSDGYQFGDNPTGSSGLIAGKLPVKNLDIELAEKYNVGIDMQLFQKFSMTADFFIDKRSRTMIESENLYSGIIGTGIPQQNIGQMQSKGIDLGLTWRDNINKNFNYYIGGTLSIIDTEIIENGEGYKPYNYLSKIGNRYGQCYGLEAIGYFRDQTDIDNSPKQMFSEVKPGDIKYKDQNNDGRIDQYDEVAIGYSSSIPGIYYGINLGLEYKGFGIDLLFQGVGQYSRMLNTQSIYWPMRNNNSNLTKWYLEDNVRWTEDTKDIATLPRLTTLDNANNFRNSTQWLENGAFFKLRNLNIYYTLPSKWTNKIKLDKCQIYIRGNNLFSLDHIKYLNCEDLSIGYPDLMSIHFGVNINF